LSIDVGKKGYIQETQACWWVNIQEKPPEKEWDVGERLTKKRTA
jgi:hypothetical protein